MGWPPRMTRIEREITGIALTATALLVAAGTVVGAALDRWLHRGER